MFVPFTGIDNHQKCVTFAAGLIRDETAETYTWLLNCFMKAFKKEPTMVVTDQDKSMDIAIRNVFKTAKHRLCMWHITQKLPSKVIFFTFKFMIDCIQPDLVCVFLPNQI